MQAFCMQGALRHLCHRPSNDLLIRYTHIYSAAALLQETHCSRLAMLEVIIHPASLPASKV